MFLRIVFLAVCFFSFLTGSAQAQEYTTPTWTNLVQTLIRMKAVDISDPVLIDEYALVAECDLYETFYLDDFKWNKVRKALRDSIQANVGTYPTRYRYDIEMQLDRYDFTTKTFRFTDKSTPKNDNWIPLFTVDQESACDIKKVYNFPSSYYVVLTTPLFLEGLPMAQKDAKILIMRMQKSENPDRIIYASYNLKIAYIEPMRKTRQYDASTRYEQADQRAFTIRLDGQLESISFYEDPARTRLIYKLQM